MLAIASPSDFGVNNYQWFYFTDDDQLMKGASDSKKLGVSYCTVYNLIKDTVNIEVANSWLINNIKQNELFLDELNKDSQFQKISRNFLTVESSSFIKILNKLKFILFKDNKLNSIEEISENDKYLICFDTILDLKSILSTLGFVMTETNFSDFKELLDYLSSDIKYLKDNGKLFNIISERTSKNTLSNSEKKTLFLIFEDLNEKLLSSWVLFKNENNEIISINNLVSVNCELSDWLIQFKINHNEYFDELDKYLIKDNSIYSKIIIPNWNQIIENYSVKDNPYEFYLQVMNYYDLDKEKIELNGDVILSANFDYKSYENIYFNKLLNQIQNYDIIGKIIESNSNLVLPNEKILSFLEKKPFDLKDKNILDVLNYPISLSENELSELINFINLSNEQLFSKVIISQDSISNNYKLSQKSDNNFQYYLDQEKANLNTFIENDYRDKYINLPHEIAKLIHNKTDLLTEKEILELILKDNHDPKDIYRLYLDSNSEDIKVDFLNYISDITLRESTNYDKSSFEFNIFKLVSKYLSDDEDKLDIFRAKIFIENDKGEKRKLYEVAYNNKIRFSFDKSEDSYDLELSEILPSYVDKSGLMEKIISNFKGFGEYDLRNKIFKVGSYMRKEEILKELNNDLMNSHQLVFFLLMIRYKRDLISDKSKYRYNSLSGIKNFKITKKNYFINEYDFINKDFVLTSEYKELTSLLKINKDNPFFTSDEITIAIKPFLKENLFVCSPVLFNLKEDSKSQKELFLHLYEEFYNNGKRLDEIKLEETCYLHNKVVTKIYNDENKINYFGINPEEIVFPSDYALKEEIIPEWVIDWIEIGEKIFKLKFLKALGLKDEDSDLVKLRKFFIKKLDNIDDNIIYNLASTSKKYIRRTIGWLLLQQDLLFKSFSIQLKYLIELLNIYIERETFPVILVNNIIKNEIKDYELVTFNEKAVHSYWLLNDNIIDDLKSFGNETLDNIFNYIRKKDENLIHTNIFSRNYLEKFEINFLEYDVVLDSSYLLSNSMEYDKPYYSIWKNELSGEFRIYIVPQSIENNYLRYSLLFQKENIQIVKINNIDIDETKSIFIVGNGEIEILLEKIVGRNGFEQKHLDLLLEKKQFEPEEIDKYYEDIYSEPTTESIEYLEEQTNRYFPDGEKENFEEKLISLLNVTPSSWGNGFIFHFTHIENAISIIENKKILSRNFANTVGFNDAASSEQISRTRSFVHNYARFYFRPLTPTQWHNEGLGRNRYRDNPKCPIPIFFKINIADVLKKNHGKCFVSNGNLSSDWAKIGNSYGFLKKLDFLNLYSTFGNYNFKSASQQEFIVENELDLKDIYFEIICRNSQDKEVLSNLLENTNNVNIGIDDGYYFKSNPFINHERKDNFIEITISKPKFNNYTIKFESEQTRNINKIEGNFMQLINNNGGTSIQFKLSQNFPTSSLEFSKIENYSVYYTDETNSKWLIYTTKNLVNLDYKPNSEFLNKIISLDLTLKQYFNTQVRHYTLYEHTILVLNEFDKYFGESTIKGIISKESFKTFLAIHDIGKPLAHIESSKENQYRYSTNIFEELKDKLELNDKEINIFYSLLNGDPLGLYFQNKFDIDKSIDYFRNLNQKYNIPISELFYLYTIYYQVDAGSYTLDAGGMRFLEKVFEYENSLKKYDSIQERLVFSELYEEKYNLLSNKIKENGN